MKKIFSSRVGDIEVIVEHMCELLEGDPMVSITSRKGRVVKHSMGRSRTIVNYKDFEALSEAKTNYCVESMRWHIRESLNEWNNRKGETK